MFLLIFATNSSSHIGVTERERRETKGTKANAGAWEFGSQSMLIIYYLDNKSKSVYSSTDVNLCMAAAVEMLLRPEAYAAQ